jgi:transglutaminase-like putative cysteine protease
LRAAGIPAALGFADVRNHINTPKLTELMGTDLFIYHGYVQVWLDGKSYKITPAFNMELCERFGVKPLHFDGKSDALFHEFDQKNQRHMEYVNDRGVFKDMPIDQFLRDFRAAYPNMITYIERGGIPTAPDAFTE